MGTVEGANVNIDNKYLNTIRLVCQPLPTDPDLLINIYDNSTGAILVNPWAGIMIPISGSYERDKRKYKHFNFWLKSSRKFGVLYVDFGRVRQDLSLNGGPPNERIDSELENSMNGEYILEDDIGIDFLEDESESYLFPHLDNDIWKWDTLKYYDPRLQEFSQDPHRDNWERYYIDQTSPTRTNGTEKDQKLTSEWILDDLDHTTDENFYRIKINLTSLDNFQFIDTTLTNDSASKYSWYPISIPINEPGDVSFDTIVGIPDWKHICFVRIFWTDFDKSSINELTKDYIIEFTGFRFDEE